MKKNDRDPSENALIDLLEQKQQELDLLHSKLEEEVHFRSQIEVLLHERLKELTCHNQLTELFTSQNELTDDLLERLLQIVSAAFQFSEMAEVELKLKDKTYRTPGYTNCHHFISQPLTLYQEVVGHLHVGYPDGSLPKVDPIFQPEEQALLLNISLRLKRLLENVDYARIIQKNEVEYRDMIENISDAIYKVDIHEIITYISPSIYKILGFTPEEVIGRRFVEFVGENQTVLRERFKKLMTTSEIENVYNIRSKSGKEHWIRLSTKAILENGEFKGGIGTLVDITEKKLMELELNKSEALYRSILEASPDVFAIINKNGFFDFLSPKVMPMFRLESADQLLHRSVLDVVDESDKTRAIKALEQISLGILPDSGEYKLHRSDGTHFYGEVDGEFIRDERGAPTNMIFIIRDVSDGKEAEEKLRISEEIYRNLVERSNDVIYEISMDGKIRYISPVIEKLTGFKPDYLIGRYFMRYVYKPDRKRLIEQMSTDDSDQQPFVEYRYLNQSGELRWVRTSATTLIENGIPVGKHGTIIDVTEKKLAEENLERQNERMSAILKAMPDLIFIMDKNGTYLEYFADNVDYLLAPKEELIGKNMLEVFEKEMANLHISKIKECIRTKKLITYDYSVMVQDVLSYYEVRLILLADEKVFRFVRNITERKRAENEILDLNTNLENKIKERTSQLASTNKELLFEIEERKRVEEDLKKARLEAEEANLAKSEFLSRMSHELRTPMNSILGFAQLLDMGQLDVKQRKGVKHILYSGKILLELINEVLDISRIESGKLSLSMEPVQIETIVMEMMDVVSPLAKANQIQIHLVESPLNKLCLKSDKQRLKQILINLMTNAIKYNKKGGQVQIKTEWASSVDPEKPCIRLSISDTGKGLSMEESKKLFTPFERIGAEKSETEGTGLGLTVVKKLVEAMGGTIGVDSVKNEGSVFWFELPQDSCLQDSFKPENMVEPLNQSQPNKGLILYVEDNRPNIELVEQILSVQRFGIELRTCMNATDALVMARTIQPDLILMDLNLPDMHGSELFELLAKDKRTKDIPVVVISADAMPNQSEKLIHQGVKYYLTKPLNVMDFLRVIDDFI